MKWTKTAPTEAGWYWFRGYPYHGRGPVGPIMVDVSFDADDPPRLCVGQTFLSNDAPGNRREYYWEGEWSGPIPEPEEQSDDSV